MSSFRRKSVKPSELCEYAKPPFTADANGKPIAGHFRLTFKVEPIESK